MVVHLLSLYSFQAKINPLKSEWLLQYEVILFYEYFLIYLEEEFLLYIVYLKNL